MRFGVQNPAIPASVSVGLIAFVGQTFIQSPHRWQSFKKSFSGNEPGGLIRRASDTWCNLPSNLPSKGKDRPANKPPNTARRPISGFLLTRGGHANLKAMAFSGQELKQLKQSIHSVASHSCPGIGEAAPWHDK
jgi:hypothetical protein